MNVRVLFSGSGAATSPLVLQARAKPALSPYGISAAAEPRKKAPVLLPNFSCRSLRHTFTTRLVEAEY